MLNPLTAAAIYLMIWFVSLFLVLPLWNISHHEAGIETTDGGDPGAPLVTNLKKKALINTALAFVVWVFIMLALHFHWFSGLIPN